MTGVFLRTGNRKDLFPNKVGELCIATDTDELITFDYFGNVVARDLFPSDTSFIIFSDGKPSDDVGENGYFAIDTSSDEFIEYFKFNGTWIQRTEGYNEEYLQQNFEEKVYYPYNSIKRNGENSLSIEYIPTEENDISTYNYFLEKKNEFLNSNQDPSEFIFNDGSNTMDEGYYPVVKGQVVTLEAFNDGIAFTVPTKDPRVPGAIWNDNGTLRVSAG